MILSSDASAALGLALVQGLFDVLPVGGTGVRILLQRWLEWPPLSHEAEIATRLAIMVAIAACLWRELADVAVGLWNIVRRRRSPKARIAWHLIVACVPPVAAEMAMTRFDYVLPMTSAFLAWCLVAGGVMVWLADRIGMTVRRLEHLGIAGALFVGLLLAASVVPAAGRVALVLLGARLLSFERAAAARLALLLSLPILFGGTAEHVYAMVRAGESWSWLGAAMAGAAALVGAFIGIGMLLSWTAKRSLAPFALLRIAAGGAALILLNIPSLT